jgi:hypothetical protein
VLHQAGPEMLGPDLPDFLDAEAVFLVVAVAVQLETGDRLLGQAAARALG